MLGILAGQAMAFMALLSQELLKDGEEDDDWAALAVKRGLVSAALETDK
jgi:hypothetical protein